MLKICLVFWKSEPQYAYRRYAYKKHVGILGMENTYSCPTIVESNTKLFESGYWLPLFKQRRAKLPHS